MPVCVATKKKGKKRGRTEGVGVVGGVRWEMRLE